MSWLLWLLVVIGVLVEATLLYTLRLLVLGERRRRRRRAQRERERLDWVEWQGELDEFLGETSS